MQFFVSEVHYAILLYSYNFFLLRSLIFSLNVKQLLQNSCEIIIFPNDIKFQNYLLINPFEFLQSRANSNSQEPPPLQSWADYCISHPSFPCKWALDGEVISTGNKLGRIPSFTCFCPGKVQGTSRLDIGVDSNPSARHRVPRRFTHVSNFYSLLF